MSLFAHKKYVQRLQQAGHFLPSSSTTKIIGQGSFATDDETSSQSSATPSPPPPKKTCREVNTNYSPRKSSIHLTHQVTPAKTITTSSTIVKATVTDNVQNHPSDKWIKILDDADLKHRKKVQEVTCVSCFKTYHSYADLWTHDLSCYKYIINEMQKNRDLIPGYDEWLERSRRFTFACTFCEVGVNTMLELRDHLKTHTDEASFQCKLCLNKFHTMEDATDHLLDKHRIDPWSDTKRLSYAGAMLKIQQTISANGESGNFDRSPTRASPDYHHSNRAQSENTNHYHHEDQQSEQSGMLDDDLGRNIRFNGRPDGFKCVFDTCGQVFTEEKHAYVHDPCFKPILVSNGSKEVWLCEFEECRKPFDSKFLLQQHTGHHLERRYECLLCGHLFTTCAQARQHIKAHSK